MLHINNRRPAASVEDMPIRLYGVVRESIVDGPGLRFVVFTQGCPHRCEGCHNPASHDYEGGYMSSTSRIWRAVCEQKLLRGITFSGGEPFLWGKELSVIARAARNMGLDVMVYSGYTYEQLLEMAKSDEGVYNLLCASNYLVDGKFEIAKRDLNLRFRGSSNQNIYDITCYPNSTKAAKIEL